MSLVFNTLSNLRERPDLARIPTSLKSARISSKSSSKEWRRGCDWRPLSKFTPMTFARHDDLHSSDSFAGFVRAVVSHGLSLAKSGGRGHIRGQALLHVRGANRLSANTLFSCCTVACGSAAVAPCAAQPAPWLPGFKFRRLPPWPPIRPPLSPPQPSLCLSRRG